jgi:hypothetical protein
VNAVWTTRGRGRVSYDPATPPCVPFTCHGIVRYGADIAAAEDSPIPRCQLFLHTLPAIASSGALSRPNQRVEKRACFAVIIAHSPPELYCTLAPLPQIRRISKSSSDVILACPTRYAQERFLPEYSQILGEMSRV